MNGLAEISDETANRFWRLASKGDRLQCWPWLGSKFKGKQYGQFKAHGKNWRAHRMAWVLTYGSIPAALYVCHACDNPACVNPRHLLLGSNEANMADMVAKGRSCHGEKNSAARITAQIAHEMRVGFNHGLTTRKLAELYGVGLTTAKQVVSGATWVAHAW